MKKKLSSKKEKFYGKRIPRKEKKELKKIIKELISLKKVKSMKTIKTLIFAVLFCIIAVFLFSCKKDEVTPDVPFSIDVAQQDTSGLINTEETLSMALVIDPSFTGDKSESFSLNVSGLAGNLKIGSLTYSSGISLSAGTYELKYTPTASGKQKLIFTATNKAGSSRIDTAYYNVQSYIPVPFSISVNPTDFTGSNNAPGTQLSTNISVSSTDATGTMKYYLSWTTNGALSIYYNPTTAFVQNTEINKGSNNLKVNIPGGHPDGDYWLALQIKDSNGDIRKDTVYVKVGN